MQESYMLEESISNDFLSQSYLQGVKRITGTNNFDPKLEIPKKVLEGNWEVREKTWNHLFDKYSEEPSSDIEVNIITCEPEEEVSDEEHSCGQQIRMHKPASLIQYWINTGNPPYKIFLNENEDIGSSLSEEESIFLSEEESISLSKEGNIFLGEEENISLKQAPFSLHKSNKQECRNNSSSSSVDTAAYILSNANITKKTDTMAIIEGAKCPNIKSSKNMKDIKTISNDKTEYMRIARSDQCDSDANVNTNLPNTEMDPTEHVVSKMHTQPSTLSTNTLQPNISQYSACEKIDKINTNVRNIHDIASIFQQFDKTSQRLAGNDKENITLDEIKVNRNTSDVKDQIEVNRNNSDVNQESTSTIMTDTSITYNSNITMISQRKKLYTGRNSPIDLTLINRHNTNRLSQTNHSLHPALDTDCTITRKITFLSRKNKNKRLSLLDKKSLDLKKRIRKRKRSKFVKNNRDSDNSIISSYQSLSNFHNNTQDNIPSDKRIMIQQNNDTNSFIKDEIYKQDLASLNLNPVVLLERITPFKHKPSLVKNNHNMQENDIRNKHFVKTSRNLYDSENEDLQSSRTSNTSTILISKHSKFSKNNRDSNNSIISSYQNLSNFHNNTQDDIPLYKKITVQQNNDTNSFIKDEIYKQDLASLNLNPVVLLERITPFKHKPSLVKNMQENSVRNKHFVKMSRNVYDCKNEDLRSTTSNTSTILISKCEKDVPQTEESSDSSFKLKLSIDDNSSVENIEKKVDKLSKDTIIIQTKEPREPLIESLSLLPNKNINTTVTSQVLNKDDGVKQKEVLDKSQIHLYGTNKIGSLNVKDIKRSQINKNCIDSIRSQILNKNDAIQQKEVLRESEARFSNLHKTNKDNIKFREAKVVLEQLPTNISLKKSITDINLYSDKNKISQNTSLRNNKIKSPIDNNLLKMCIKSKKNDKLNDTSDIVSEHENQVSDEAKSNSANYTCSILSLSSDEDDFVKLLQNPKRLKRSSESIDSKTLNKTNTVNNRNLSTIIFSSKEATPRKIDNNIIENFNERDKTVPNVTNINNSRRLDTVIKRNETDRKNNINIIFQTKTDYTDSLYFQENNSHTTFRKALKSSSTQSKSRSNRINKERLFKDSTRNKYTISFSNSSNSSIEECDTKQSHNMSLRSTSNRKAEVSKSSANEEFNDINLRSNNNTKKNNKSLSFINDKQDTSVEKETFVTSFGKNNLSNLSESKQIPDKSKNSLAMQPNSSATKLLRFQTKSYYDSDSSVSS